MLTSIVFFLIFVSESFGVENFHVQIIFDAIRAWDIRGTNLQTGRSHRMTLHHFGSHHALTFRLAEYGSRFDFVDLHLPRVGAIDFDESGRILDTSQDLIDVYHELIPAVNGPVSFRQLRHEFERAMILNSTDSNFASSCLPNSIISVPNLLSDNRFELAVSLSADPNSPRTTASYNINYSREYIARIPEAIFNTIADALTTAGAVPEFGPEFPEFVSDLWEQCEPEMITTLPTVEFTFTNGERILITPQDYVFVTPVVGECILKVAQCGYPLYPPCQLHPLAIPNLNFRLLQDGTVQFCDAV